MSNNGTIIKVSGALVVAKGLSRTSIYDMVRVGRYRLFGEVVEIRGDEYFIQVYEETEGLGHGETVYSTHNAFSVELGPGLIGAIYDGIQRPLDVINRIETANGTKELTMLQKWPVRSFRRVKKKLNSTTPLVTGQRIIDTFFPITKGGVACVPGPFGDR